MADNKDLVYAVKGGKTKSFSRTAWNLLKADKDGWVEQVNPADIIPPPEISAKAEKIPTHKDSESAGQEKKSPGRKKQDKDADSK